MIFYPAIGFLPLIASTIVMNDTLSEKVQSNVSCRVIRDCIEVDKVKEGTTRIARLIESSMVNMVDITVFTRDKKQRYEVLLVNDISSKILPLLDERSLPPFTVRPKGFKSTLNAGRRNFEFYLNEIREGCIESELNGIESLAKYLLSKVAANMKATNYEIEMCYLTGFYNLDKTGMKCCRMIECYYVPKTVYGFWFEFFVFYLAGSYNAILVFGYAATIFKRFKKSNREQTSYYMLTDNRMSICYRFGDLIYWKRGCVIYFVRALLLAGICLWLFNETFKIGIYIIIPSVGGLSFIITMTYLVNDNTEEPKLPKSFRVIAYPLNFVFLCITVVVAYCLPIVATCIVTGIVYNILYYLSYITFSSVFIFCSWHLWKSTMEVRQYTLQMLIHEALENLGNDDVPEIENKKVVLVLSKYLYHKIEKKLLPFKKCLRFFFIKFVFLFLVLFFVFHPVFFLFESDFNSDAKVLTAMGVTAFTFPLNMIIEKKNEELVTAWRKEMKINVTRMVYWYAKRGNQEITRTFLPVSSLVDEIDRHSVVDETERHSFVDEIDRHFPVDKILQLRETRL